MENENLTPAQEDVVTSAHSPLHTVTPFSKYLAMGLFIVLPFLGGWIGYSYAPGEIVEVKKTVETTNITPTTENVINEQVKDVNLSPEEFSINLQRKLSSNVSPQTIMIGDKYPYYDFWKDATKDIDLPSRAYGAGTFKRLTKDYRQVSFSASPKPFYYLFDVQSLKFIRSLDDEKPHSFSAATNWYFNTDRGNIEVSVSSDRIILHDYVNQEQRLLYEESEEDVSLLRVCELGCSGTLLSISGPDVVFSRYQNNPASLPADTPREMIDVVTLKLPEGWSEGW